MPKQAFKLDVTSTIQQFVDQVPKQYKAAIDIAAARAINKAMAKTQTRTRRDLAKRMGVQQKEIRSGVMIRKKAHRESLSSSMGVKGGRPPNVIRFNRSGATQVATGVMHGAWQPGAKKKLAVGAFLMPTSGAKKGGRTRKASTTTARKASSGSRKRTPSKKFTATSNSHFVAKRTGRQVKGVWGTSPAMNFMWTNRAAGQRGLIRGTELRLAKEFPVQFKTELVKEVQRQAGLLTFQRGGGIPRKRVVRRNRRTGLPTVRSVKAITVGRLPG
jgi:hypothetical protein